VRRDTRGRLTIPDVVFALVSIAFLSALVPIVMDLLASSDLGTGTTYLFRLVPPLAVLVLIAGAFRKSVRGLGR
jgi:cytochrome c biogenesis factor